MSKRVLCKFFAHGACLKGEHCEFSHDWNVPANNVCTFYQKGACAFGSRCRYEHVKASRAQSAGSSSSTSSQQSLAIESVSLAHPPRNLSSGVALVPGTLSELSASSSPFLLPSKPAWNGYLDDECYGGDGDDGDNVGETRNTRPEDRAICSFAAAGNCPRGEKCPHIHGDICPSCGKHCLHPYRPMEREEHMKTCEEKQKQLEALKCSQEIECSVCLERVLLKPTVAERKFGILSECDHPFCISCIRNWRSTSPTSGMDVNSALRSCPICRKLSYFVIPSVIWYGTKEEKQEIVDSYKSRLSSIDCKHFGFGNGNCPFGTSCFYKHAYQDGRLEEVALRHLGNEDGQTVIATNIRLSDFLSDLHIRIFLHQEHMCRSHTGFSIASGLQWFPRWFMQNCLLDGDPVMGEDMLGCFQVHVTELKIKIITGCMSICSEF